MLGTVVQIIMQYKAGLWSGLLVSLSMVVIVWTVGLTIGLCVGWYAQQYKSAGYVVGLFWFLITSIPILVILFWLHFPLQEMLGIVIKPFITAVLALSFINIIFVATIIKEALAEFQQQYLIIGKVSGLNELEIFIKIKWPLMLRAVLPQLLFLQVAMLQATIFSSLISVEEIFRVTQRINSIIYKPVETYTTLAIFFCAICLPLNLTAYWLKNKYTRSFSVT